MMTENQISHIVVDCAIALHRELGPSLLESVYEALLAHKLALRGLQVERQVFVPVVFDGIRFDAGFRADIVVENKVILELKSVDQLSKNHHKQLLTYLRLANFKLGFILNFGRPMMKMGIRRVVNGLHEESG